ncbi:14-3-3 Protein Eta [Manis pentadactyla]|nr:14-3-3 Protein Eta [Manis pentadactyla]
MDMCTMVKKRLSSQDTSVFRFEITGSPRQASLEARQSSTDSPGSVFLSSGLPGWATRLSLRLDPPLPSLAARALPGTNRGRANVSRLAARALGRSG